MAVRKTKKDAIVEELRTLIESGEMARGSRVQQNELAARFDTSITPVREAMRQLQAEGLLVGEPHRGVRVASANPEAVKAVYILRRLVEPYAFRRASRRVSRQELERAERLIDAMEAESAAGNHSQVTALNREFHYLFYDRCGIASLTEQINHFWLAFPWDVLQVIDGRASESVDEHRAILSNVAAGDLDGLTRAVEEHIARSYLALVNHIQSEPVADPFELDID
jgi:DNA-binding GntR family transcriptional regulator